ncbi:MAG: galactosyldiacylglycerol synthase [Anaerolineales bacterium]
MVELFRKSDNRVLGTISDEDFQFLEDNLEEESLTDEDYTIDRLTLDYLKGNGLSPELARLLETALGQGDEVEIRYRKK